MTPRAGGFALKRCSLSYSINGRAKVGICQLKVVNASCCCAILVSSGCSCTVFHFFLSFLPVFQLLDWQSRLANAASLDCSKQATVHQSTEGAVLLHTLKMD